MNETAGVITKVKKRANTKGIIIEAVALSTIAKTTKVIKLKQVLTVFKKVYIIQSFLPERNDIQLHSTYFSSKDKLLSIIPLYRRWFTSYTKKVR